MASTRDIKRRIKSIGNTKKVTNAMQMVSAAKMRKAIEAVLKTRAYANLSWSVILNLAKANNSELHPLLVQRKEVKKIGIVLIASNRGLCGGFNSNIVRKAREAAVKRSDADGQPIDAEFILIGKKGNLVYKYFNYNIAADFPKSDLVEGVNEVVGIASMVIKDFLGGKYDKIFVVYTDFINAAKQTARIKQILPIDLGARREFLGVIGEAGGDGYSEEKKSEILEKTEYLFEPSPKEVLGEMIPRLIEIQLFQALLESNASEHCARMSAMRQATDAAAELVDELTLYYNKARQASITREIAEISAGANALK